MPFTCSLHALKLNTQLFNYKTTNEERITELQCEGEKKSLKIQCNTKLQSLVTKNPPKKQPWPETFIFIFFAEHEKKSQSKQSFKVQSHRWRYRKTFSQLALHLVETAQGCWGQFNTQIDYCKVLWEDFWAKNQMLQPQLQFIVLHITSSLSSVIATSMSYFILKTETSNFTDNEDDDSRAPLYHFSP